MGNWSFVFAALGLIVLMVAAYVAWTVRLYNRTRAEVQTLQRTLNERTTDGHNVPVDETAAEPRHS